MMSGDFRSVCSRFATGIAVLTVLDAEGKPHGLTVNSFTSVSAEPPLVLVCVDNACTLLPLFESAPHFGLSFLEESQQDVSDRFAFVPERRFDGVLWRRSPMGDVPWIEGALGWMECRVHKRIQAGDHRVLIGEVVASDALPNGQPLIYFGSGYKRLSL
jgi:flavin reductase (DIM6/NTAB) family NADH-FMN oxidoreductase RutF